MDKHDALRFKVSVSPVYTELFEAVKQAGPYYRSRRLLNLALIGLAVEKGQISTMAVSTQTTTQPPLEHAKSDQAPHYYIPDNAGDAICGMLDSF